MVTYTVVLEFEQDLTEETGTGFGGAIVIFDTRYGNTEKIAKSLARGLEELSIETNCVNTREADVESMKKYALIAIGAPTEWHSASKPMKEFLRKLRNSDLSGKYGFAFDTKLERALSGSAAKLIEKELKRSGLEIIMSHESATVFLENGGVGGAWLKRGEEERFEQLGARVGELALAAKKAEMPT